MSFWPREQPRGGRAGHDRHSQDQWEHQEGRGRPEHGFHFQMPNPWEQQQPHPTTQRDHAPVADPKNNETIMIKIPAVSWKELQYPSGKLGAVPKRPEVIDEQKQMEYLKKILSSKVYDVTSESPLHFAPNLSKGLGVNIWLKREDTHPVYSFKLRGAYNMMSSLPKEELEKGVISASTGNHAQGVAFAASKLKTQSLIVMPRSTPPNKIEAVKNLGGNVVLFGDTFDDALEHAKQLSQERNLKIITPFDDEDIIVGQGTVGMEIGRQMREPLDAIFVPVGGGGLLAGVASFYKLIYPEVKIIGVEPHDANSMASALYSDQIVQVFDIGTFADGVDIKRVGDETFRISRELVDGIVLVDKNDIAAAIKEVFEDTKSMLEPAGALAVAGAKAYCKYNNIKGGNVVAITSGANMNFDQLGSIADKVESEATFATILPEKPGTLKSTLSHLVGSRNITEIKYRHNSEKDAVVFYSVWLSDVSELEDVKKQIESSTFETYDLTNNEVFKNHLRYMVGGRSNVPNEVFYRFTLPERPGALSQCLDALSPRWNISLIHYRRQGTISADVLVGLQVPDSDMGEFNERAKKLGFEYVAVAYDDPASKLFTYI
ncbi:threonine dehydratase biosynthetic, chloroplastic-like [Cucumis melo]|uniref:Threonine dehydratase n=1 Tax=Cucumis melo TaxID=3656 RepID=A0ABM3L4V6_CUCME|nr:threonine dehydratase biosynthetic, chloroplastic-like [Cucumis melo]